MPETFVEVMNADDHAAYLFYRDKLPARAKGIIRQIVFMGIDDQRLVEHLVSIIRRSAGPPGGLAEPSPGSPLRLVSARRPAGRQSSRRAA